jgi:hypothetical protein
MATGVETVRSIPWWKEPTKDQWYAYVAAWAGWTLDAFDFTAFLLADGGRVRRSKTVRRV